MRARTAFLPVIVTAALILPATAGLHAHPAPAAQAHHTRTVRSATSEPPIPDPQALQAAFTRTAGLPSAPTTTTTTVPKPPPVPVRRWQPSPTTSPPTVAYRSGSWFQQCVIERESHGDPTAQNPWSTASGLYGFLNSTWEATTGLPGPARAYSPAIQTAAFWRLYDRDGPSPWWSDGC